MRLGINIDHVATLRNARDTRYPSPIAVSYTHLTLPTTPYV